MFDVVLLKPVLQRSEVFPQDGGVHLPGACDGLQGLWPRSGGAQLQHVTDNIPISIIVLEFNHRAAVMVMLQWCSLRLLSWKHRFNHRVTTVVQLNRHMSSTKKTQLQFTYSVVQEKKRWWIIFAHTSLKKHWNKFQIDIFNFINLINSLRETHPSALPASVDL